MEDVDENKIMKTTSFVVQNLKTIPMKTSSQSQSVVDVKKVEEAVPPSISSTFTKSKTVKKLIDNPIDQTYTK